MIYKKSGKIKCHIELSNYCNAACPMCGRNNIKGNYPHEMSIRKDVDNSELRIDDIKKIFDDRFFETYDLDVINMCGNRGDPATSKDLFEICEYLYYKQNDLKITIATNGGLKTAKYWKDLGELFAFYDNGSKVTFGIDGLKDTNHIYRQNVIFDRVIKNAQGFIDGGGTAWWQYLIFKHNEHQVDEAKKLADDMGFKLFFIMHTPRFAHKQKGEGKMTFNYKGEQFDLETVDPEFGQRQEAYKFIKSDESEEIECKAMENKEFYIDNGGRVIPCCWLGNSLDWMLGGERQNVKDRIMMLYDPIEMNAINNDLVDLLQHDFMTKEVPMSWENIQGENCAAKTCKMFCSKTKNIRKKPIVL